jgi:triosephosphate isomerase
MRKKLIAGNWKMNTTMAEAQALAAAIAQNNPSGNSVEVLICPPYLYIPSLLDAVAGNGVFVGAQNVHQAEKGAFTGEVSAAMLASTGIKHVIIGHSERRQYFGETDETVNQKTKQALAHGLTPIVCIGETLEERESGRELEVVESQVKGALVGISIEDAAKLVWAYEPVWAIGTGKTASPEQAQAMHASIRGWLSEATSEAVSEGTRILYGGSMNDSNASTLLAQPDIDGGLIGGASLKAEAFQTIIDAAA